MTANTPEARLVHKVLCIWGAWLQSSQQRRRYMPNLGFPGRTAFSRIGEEPTSTREESRKVRGSDGSVLNVRPINRGRESRGYQGQSYRWIIAESQYVAVMADSVAAKLTRKQRDALVRAFRDGERVADWRPQNQRVFRNALARFRHILMDELAARSRAES
jgi:hypothetical protein